MENQVSQKLVQDFFDSLPKREILECALATQKQIQEGNLTIIKKKKDNTTFTEADIQIEKMIIDYLWNSW
jgi:fructose-1,6-bisphosphatase/inositol monophosphatase family enzyme